MEEYLRSFKIFSEKEIEEVLNISLSVSLDKNDFFIKEGNTCQRVAFVVSGIFRSFYVSSSDEEVTYCLTFPNNFVSAYSSYIMQEKTVENIQAITSTELLVIPKKEMDQLIKENRNWLLFSKIIAEQQYIALENRIFQLQKEKAEKRYVDLIKNHPEYIQNIPLQYLASYLGITQRHLSRLRKNISF